MSTRTTSFSGDVLIVGASRGLGYAITKEYLERGRHVVGTVRSGRPGKLPELLERWGERLETEIVDITVPEQIAALRSRLEARTFDLLLVNAGTVNEGSQTVAEVSTHEFERVLVTNALSPMRVVERLGDLVAPDGTIAVMSSGRGSVANNNDGKEEIYRASKAALNTLMRSYAARHSTSRRTLLLLAPGWIRTDLGGPDAPYSLEEAVPPLVTTIESQRGTAGLRYIDRFGNALPW